MQQTASPDLSKVAVVIFFPEVCCNDYLVCRGPVSRQPPNHPRNNKGDTAKKPATANRGAHGTRLHQVHNRYSQIRPRQPLNSMRCERCGLDGLAGSAAGPVTLFTLVGIEFADINLGTEVIVA